MKILRPYQRSALKGDPRYFTGEVYIERLVDPIPPSRTSIALVTFTPGARTAWHTHPAGQTLIVINGCGIVQVWGEQPQLIQPGDIIVIPPNVKHWHGALDTISLTHIAIQEIVEGSSAQFMEHVDDTQYDEAVKIIKDRLSKTAP